MSDTHKSHGVTFGFTTAGGSSIKVSEKALSKAKELFTEELIEPDNNEETEYTHKTNDDFNMQMSNNRFPTTDKRRVTMKNKTLIKESRLSDDEAAENTKNVIHSIGFKTAAGNSVNVSSEALLTAQQKFNDMEDQVNESNLQIMNNRFKTLGERRSGVTKVVQQEAEKPLVEKTKISVDNTMSSMGFKTASGSSINVLEKALSKARQLFANDLNDMNEFKEPDLNEKEISEPETQMLSIGFETANGQSVNISKEALMKAKAQYYEDNLEDLENDSLITKSLQKRKIKDLDDDIYLNKQVPPNHFKKLRFSNESHVPKTVSKESRNITEKQGQTSTSTKDIITKYNTNKSSSNNAYKTQRNRENNKLNDFSISHEIEASTVALLADEINSDFSEQWSPPVESTSENDINIPSSPVIGGNFIPRKRKCLGGRKKNVNVVKNKVHKSMDTDNLKQLSNNCGTSRQYIKEGNKLLIEKQELVNKENNCGSSSTNDFGDTQLILDFLIESTNILEKRLEAALEQEELIVLKKRSRPKPTISKLYFHRKSNCKNRVSWREISRGNAPILCTYEELIEQKLPPELLNVTAENALIYKLRCTDFYGQEFVQNNINGIQLEDDACLILDENGYAGISEIKRSLLATPGVDLNLLPDGWIENHYKWIVWKLASMDRVRFGSIKLPRALTPARVMLELKYRYTREIDRSQRSALRKILEKDDVSSKRMVLCVSSITEYDNSVIMNRSQNEQNTPIKLTLTDGWYSVPASIDQAMIKNITCGKVKEGTKIMTYGSELLNCDQGCAPLELPENVCLKIHTNSTRRAKWDTRLGYVVPPGPMYVKLRTVYSNGGLIGKIKVLVARVYPILYHEKTSSGESIFRNARCEEKANIAHEKECRSMIEAFYAKAETYFSEKKPSASESDSLDVVASELNENREMLWQEEFLSKHEQEQLVNKCRVKEEQFRQKLESRLHKSLPPSRQVKPILKIRVVEGEATAILSVWSPSEEVVDILKEGKCISICNIAPLGKSRGTELQLTANRNTVFKRESIPESVYPRRTYTALSEVNKASFAPAYGEFDTVGFVVSIRSEPYGMKNFEAVFLAYPHSDSQSSYLSVLFWHGISSCGYAEILTVGSLVACSNLEWRRATPWNIPISYYTERSTFTRNARQSHLQQPTNEFKRLVSDTNVYIATCTTEISEELQRKSSTRMSDQFVPDGSSLSKTAFSETPEKQLGNLMSQTAKSVAIQKRLEKLQYYGEASSLSPIVLKNSSKRVSLDFQSPLRPSEENQTKSRTSLNTKYSLNSR